MELVKLKMKKKYKTSLSFISLLLIGCLVIGGLYYLNARFSDDNSKVEVLDNLSINYVNGKNFDLINDEEEIKISITNNSNKVNYFNINFSKVRGSGKYKVYLDNSLITEGDLNTIDDISSISLSIDEKATNNYIIKINKTETLCKGTLNIKVQNSKNMTFKDIILQNTKASTISLTKPGNELATVDEGLIKSTDDIGITYYFRGDVQNNYVSFGDLLWRIVRINGDGTVRMILDGTTDSVSSYYNEELNMDFRYSTLKTYLDTWLEDNLKDNTKYIANTQFCNDVSHDDGYNFDAYTRVSINKIPTFNCLGTVVVSNIGTLSIDEVLFAGALLNEGNINYYLYNSEIQEAWYTLSGAKGNETELNLFMINANGSIDTNVNGNLYRNVRPVINLIKNIEVVGTGTKDDPYTLEK